VLYPAVCTFPDCQQPASASKTEEGIALCFWHREMLFYDAAQFTRLWKQRHPDS
jgi:hypothetical protein